MTMTNRDMTIHLVDQFKITSFQAELVIRALQENDEIPEPAYEVFYEYYCNNGEMPYGTAKARDGDPYEWIGDRIAQELEMN